MKSIKILGIMAAAMAMTLSSCSDDFLERNPGDALSPATFWKTENDADLALTGVYNRLYSPFRPEERWFWDCATDNAFCYHRNKDWRSLGDGTMAATGVAVHDYFTYIELRVCNEYLKEEGNIAWSSEAKRNQYKAEVRMIRAMHLFFRVTCYGDFPFSEDVFETPDEAMVSRTPKADLLAFIKKEMEDVVQYLPEPSATVRGRINKEAAKAFLTRFYLYTGDYQSAARESNEVIQSGLFQMPDLTYEESFLVKNQMNSEVILSFEHNRDGGFGMWVGEYFPNGYGGWSSIVPTRSLLDTYETKNGLTIDEDPTYDPQNPFVGRDPRLRATIVFPGQTWGIYANQSNYPHGYPSIEKGSGDYWSDADNATHTGMSFKKFYSDPTEYSNIWSCERNFPMFRYAEILLSYAEAKVELGQIDATVYDAIDQVRHRAGLPAVDRTKYASQEKLRELVRRERRVEFAYEGLRRDDIIRWGIAKDVMNATIYHMNGTITDQLNAEGDYNVRLEDVTDQDVEERRVFTVGKNELLPVPQSAIDANPNLSQNPGY